MKHQFSLILIVLAITSNGQSLLQQANEKFANKDWNGASLDYQKHLKKNENDSAAWYNLGKCQMNLNDYEKSITSFNKARATNYNSLFVDFNMAKIQALKNDEEKMYSILEESVKNGLFTFIQLQSDPAFQAYQSTDRFKSILEGAKVNAYPCMRNPIARHFDFWIGEWDVYFNGQKVGENSITLAQGGCAIHENYTTAGAYAGQSINFYSPVDEKWHQHWVGSSGDVYNYVETKRGDGLLQFESEFINPQGQLTLSRLTFTLLEDGTVTQLFQNSSDSGKTWTDGFNGIYKRKE